jgi:uncharacterized membrane protein YukC
LNCCYWFGDWHSPKVFVDAGHFSPHQVVIFMIYLFVNVLIYIYYNLFQETKKEQTKLNVVITSFARFITETYSMLKRQPTAAVQLLP